MKKFFVMMIMAMVGASVFAQSVKQVTVGYAQSKASSYESVILEGKITAQIDHDEFILSDKSGSIKLELEGPSAYQALSQNMIGKMVRVYGVVDKDHQWDNAEIKALKIRLVSANADEAAPVVESAPVVEEGLSPAAEGAVQGEFGSDKPMEDTMGGTIPDNF